MLNALSILLQWMYESQYERKLDECYVFENEFVILCQLEPKDLSWEIPTKMKWNQLLDLCQLCGKYNLKLVNYEDGKNTKEQVEKFLLKKILNIEYY